MPVTQTQTTKQSRSDFNLQMLKQIRAEIRKEAEAAQPKIKQVTQADTKQGSKK